MSGKTSTSWRRPGDRDSERAWANVCERETPWEAVCVLVLTFHIIKAEKTIMARLSA